MNDKKLPEEQQKIIDYALKELQGILKQVKNGQTPSSPKELKKIYNLVKSANTQLNKQKISEDQMNDLIKDIAEKIDIKKE
jgi:isochorismate synthase EntC